MALEMVRSVACPWFCQRRGAMFAAGGQSEGGGVSSAVSASGYKIRAGTAGVKACPRLLQGGIGWGGRDTGQQGVAVLMMWIQLRR